MATTTSKQQEKLFKSPSAGVRQLFPKIPKDFYSKSYLSVKQKALDTDELFNEDWEQCTDLEKEFLANYLVHFSKGKAMQAALSANGTNPKLAASGAAAAQAQRIMGRPHVQRAVKRFLELSAQTAVITPTWILEQARELFFAARSRESDVVAIRCLELMGKHVDVQAFKENIEVNVNVDYERRLNAAKERLIEVKKAEGNGSDSSEVVIIEE